VHVLASEAHDHKHRKPTQSEARDVVSMRLGADIARTLVLDNPEAIICLPFPSKDSTARPWDGRT